MNTIEEIKSYFPNMKSREYNLGECKGIQFTMESCIVPTIVLDAISKIRKKREPEIYAYIGTDSKNKLTIYFYWNN